MKNKSKAAILLAIIIIVSLVYHKISKQQDLAEIVANSSIVDYKTALPKSGFVLATGYVSAINPPQIPDIDINTESTIALILNVEVYQLKTTEKKVTGHYVSSSHYESQMVWFNSDIVDIENVEFSGKMPREYKAQIYIGSDFKFRDSIDLDQSTFTDDLYKLLENQYSKSVIEYDSDIDILLNNLDPCPFTIMEFNPPDIKGRKIFKVYNWIGGNEFKEVYKKNDGYTSYFEKYGSVELGQTIETNLELENDDNFKRIKDQRYFQYYFYGNDPNNPISGDIRIQVLAIESKSRHSINKLIGVASGNMLKPFDDHYIFNADEKIFNRIIQRKKDMF